MLFGKHLLNSLFYYARLHNTSRHNSNHFQLLVRFLNIKLSFFLHLVKQLGFVGTVSPQNRVQELPLETSIFNHMNSWERPKTILKQYQFSLTQWRFLTENYLPISSQCSLLISLKTSEKQRFSHVSREIKRER